MNKAHSECEVERSESAGSLRQSLFNIYYLGNTKVDRRCNSSMMPWIIEELKLKADEMKFIWLSPGCEGVSFVADNGQELFKHSYGSILQCCLAVDGISFAYAARHEKDKYYCHVFQALTYEEAAKIMQEFKEHAQEEVSVPPTISHTSSAPTMPADAKSSGYIMSVSSSSDSLPSEETFRLQYWGRFEVPSPASSNTDQVLIIDSLVAKIKETVPGKGPRLKKRSFGSRFMRSSSAKASSGVAVEGVDSGVVMEGVDGAASSKEDSEAREDSDVAIMFTPSSPVGEEGETAGSTSSLSTQGEPSGCPDNPADVHTSCNQSSNTALVTTAANHQLNERSRTESADFDTLPELDNLKSTTEFQALSGALSGEGGKARRESRELGVQKVRLVFSGVSVVVTGEQTQHIILKKSMRSIACCAQGKKESEYVAFTCRSKENKKYYSYLFMARNSKMAVKVLESFKSAFVHALSMMLPPAVCEYCPYNQIQQLCKALEGVSTQVAQSRLQDCLATLAEGDYQQIMLQYKASEHADHEYTQIIVLVALLRQHFQHKQEKHTHRGLLPPKHTSSRSSSSSSTSTSTLEDSARLNVPALTRAKMAITNSFENLRSKSATEKRRKSGDKVEKNGEKVLGDERDMRTESLNVRSLSPLFARKTNIDTLMSPVSNSPLKETVERGRGRSYTAGAGEILRAQLLPPFNNSKQLEKGKEEHKVSSGEAAVSGGKDADEHRTKGAGKEEEVKTPHRNIPAKRRSLSEKRGMRHSQTPPSATSGDNGRGHKRSTSNVISRTWRQEIYDSVCTPGKLEHRADSDILEEWQVIDMVPKVEGSPSSRARTRWKKAIQQQLLLNRMERANQLFKREEKKRLKMNCYSSQAEVKESLEVWSELLEQDQPNTKHIQQALLSGVPPSRREDVWNYLSNVYQAQSRPNWDFPVQLSGEEAFQQLGQEFTEYEHNITVDLSRTFPSHPYFSSSLQRAGQSELHHILHAYAVADPETGYCQGLSFVAGLILMHTNDEQAAFNLLYKLMNLHGYKDIYRGSLSNLQVRLYQLSRLIHDFIPALHHLLQQNDITPFFYAAPWFLTIFASQYPISFTARVFDMIFYQGTDILFKVSLALLKVHETALLECESMETICAYLKNSLPEQALQYEDLIFRQALEYEFEGKLELFETEYQVMDELNGKFCVDIPLPVAQDMDSLVAMLRKNNLALVEELAICHGSISSLQQQVQALSKQLLAHQESIERLQAQATATELSSWSGSTL